MNQNHFTLGFPLKSPADAKLVAEQLPPLMPELFRANDTIGTVHYSRFTVLSEKTLLFLGDFDGEFGRLMADLAKTAVSATMTEAMLPWPPISATKRPPGFNARLTPAMTASASRIQCRAAFENTASNSADRKSTRLNSSHRCISYAVFCLKKKTHV